MSTYDAKFAGSWYPGTKAEIDKMFEDYFRSVKLPKDVPHVHGVIAPHAGYVYSGQTAAYGFKALQDTKFDLAVVLAPSHRSFLSKISTFGYSSITTPLGELEVDTELKNTLEKKSPIFGDFPSSYNNEHSFELELPFIQYVAKKSFKVLPLIIGEMYLDEHKRAAEVLNDAVKGRDVVYIASSDFTHHGVNFGYAPFHSNLAENIKNLDMEGVDLIVDNNPKGFHEYIERTGATICGKNPIIFLMNLLDRKGKLLHYTTSAEMTGDYSHSVSYASIVL